MADFSYRARDSKGSNQKGVIEALSLTEARHKLKERGLLVTDLRQTKSRSSRNNRRLKLSLKDKIILTEQLAVMVKAGLSIGKALQSLAEESENKQIRHILTDLAAAVEGGTALSVALEEYHTAFGTVYIQMVRAGEQAGSLDKVLLRLSEQLQKDYEIRSKVRGALIYPVIVVSLMFIVVVVIIVFVLPRLGEVFSDAAVELPLATRTLLAISAFSVKYGWWILGGAIAFIVSFRAVMRQPRPALWWDRFKLRLPIYGPFVKKVLMARFSLGFASLLSAGLPILTIFETLSELLDNLAYREDLHAIAHKVENGLPIADALRQSPYFPGMVAQLASIGERTGALDEIFLVVASFYEKEVDNLTRNLSSSLEPIIMVVLGVGIAFILLSVMQPMYSLVNTV